MTGRERARWADGDERGRQEVEPLTNYFVLRAHRDRTRAGYGALATAVNRDLGDPLLAAQIARSAYVAGLDGYVFLDPAKDWVVSGRVAGQPRRGRARGDRGPAARLGPLLPAARPARAAPRPDPHLARRLDGQPQPQPPVGRGAGERRRLGHEPRLRVERPRLQPAQRPVGRPRGGRAAQARAGRAHPLPRPDRRQVVRLQLRRRQAGRRGQRLRPGRLPQLLERGRQRLVPLARRSTTGRRAAGRP